MPTFPNHWHAVVANFRDSLQADLVVHAFSVCTITTGMPNGDGVCEHHFDHSKCSSENAHNPEPHGIF